MKKINSLFSELKYKKVVCNFICALTIIAILLIVDQITKFFLFDSSTIAQTNPLFQLGSLQVRSNAIYYASDPAAMTTLIVIASIIICFYFFSIAWIKKTYTIISSALIIAGLLSNMIDFGLTANAVGGMFIKDIFFIPGINPSFQMFNLAWIWLALGIILQLLFMFYMFVIETILSKSDIRKPRRIKFSSIDVSHHIVEELKTLDEKYNDKKNKNLL